MNCFICVECGENAESLYVEFSEGNIRLTRCEICGNVNDKYIEYELTLVAIDIILHRKPAFRHLLHNRQEFESTASMRWMMTGAILFNSILKLSVLHNTAYRKIFGILPSLHLITSAAVEHGVFVSAVILGLWCLPNSRNLMNGKTKFKRKVYVALAFPEIFKVAAVLLQIFDDEPTLLLLIGLLIISIQQISLDSVTSISTHKLNTIIFFAVLLRFLVRCIFHRLSDVLLLGIVC